MTMPTPKLDRDIARMVDAAASKAVAAGQVWRNNDPRTEGDLFLVTSVDAKAKTADVFRVKTRRRATIRLDRFRPTSTGYVFLGVVDHLGVR